jgi:hypothetical protein
MTAVRPSDDRRRLLHRQFAPVCDSWEAWPSQDRGAVWCSDGDGARGRRTAETRVRFDQTRSYGDSMSGLPESGHDRAIYE